MRCSAVLLALCALLIATGAVAQVAYVADATVPPGVWRNVYLPSAAYPAGVVAPKGPLALPVFGALPPMPFPILEGGHAIDQLTRSVYTTDGFVMQEETHPLYPLGVVPPPAVVVGPIITGFPVTGLAVDAVGGVLYMCDDLGFQAFNKVFPYFPVGPPIFLPFIAPPLTGLGFDPADGTLWATNDVGLIFHFTTGGAAIGPQPVSMLPPPTALPYQGLAVNTTNGAGSFPPPSCSTQMPGVFHIMVYGSGFVWDALTTTGVVGSIPVFNPGTFPPAAYGLAYSSDAQELPGAVGCLSVPTVLPIPLIGITSPAVNGPGPVVTSLFLRGGVPNAAATLLFDLCPISGGAVLATGETLWINPLSPTFGLAGVITGPGGNAFLPLGLGPAPAGVQFSAQWGIPAAAHPLGICLTDAVTITVGLP